MMKTSGSNGPINVVVLASGVNTIPLYEGYVPGYKALVPYDGRTSVQYVLDALSAVDRIGEICIEGPRALLEKELSDRRAKDDRITLVEGGDTFLDSLVIGLQHFRTSRVVLFVTADLPLITPGAVQDFLSACANATTEYAQNVYIAAAPKSSYTGGYRNFTKPFNWYRDIRVCHGNLFLLNPDLLGNKDLRKRVSRLYATRKSVWSRFAPGWQVALTYLIGVDLLHIVTLHQMAAIASRHLGVGIIPVLIDHPEITIDVDDQDDYRFVQDRIEERAKGLIPCS
jgi:CTP:molybdopterin cytidylyltransferase MocA